MQVFAYGLHGSPESLQPWTAPVGEPLVHWVANNARLAMGNGLPRDWQDHGAAFGPRGELRWWRGDDGYDAVLLSDAQVDGIPQLPGKWTASEEQVLLQDLTDRRVNPGFRCYPHGAASGALRVRVYYRDAVAVFVSPRELLSGKV